MILERARRDSGNRVGLEIVGAQFAARQVGAGDVPGVATVPGHEQHIAAVENLVVGIRRLDDRARPVESKLGGAPGWRRYDVRLLLLGIEARLDIDGPARADVDAAKDAVLPFAVEDVVVP